MTVVSVQPPRLRIHGLCKCYAVPVLSDFGFDLRSGEVHALVGANGAGKSTLARIISGLVTPEQGRMELDGIPYQPAGKLEAESAGVRMVVQELNLISSLSIAENICLNHLPRNRLGWIDRRRLIEISQNVLPRVGLGEIDPMTPVHNLGVGQQQLVEIAAALTQKSRILILDEPTAALTDPQIELLFENIRSLRSHGVGVLYISHRMDEIRRIADRVTVMRDGRLVRTHPEGNVSVSILVQEMVGRSMAAAVRDSRPAGDLAMRVRGLTRKPLVRNVDLDLHYGEILGLAGLIGSGRTETLRALFGADRPEAGEIILRHGGREVRTAIREPVDAVRLGMGMIPEDRKQHALLLPCALRLNITLAHVHAAARRFGWLDQRRERQVAASHCERLQVQCHSVEQSVAELSGGNQQKIVMARWMLRNCPILLFDEPTRGIDVASKWAIYRWMQELAAGGKAIVMVSSELEELMAVCSRIAVLSAGRLVRTFSPDEWNQETILAAAFTEYLNPPDPFDRP